MLCLQSLPFCSPLPLPSAFSRFPLLFKLLYLFSSSLCLQLLPLSFLEQFIFPLCLQSMPSTLRFYAVFFLCRLLLIVSVLFAHYAAFFRFCLPHLLVLCSLPLYRLLPLAPCLHLSPSVRCLKSSPLPVCCLPPTALCLKSLFSALFTPASSRTRAQVVPEPRAAATNKESITTSMPLLQK